MGDPGTPNSSAGSNPRLGASIIPLPPRPDSRRSVLRRVLNTRATPTVSYAAATAGSNQSASNPHAPPRSRQPPAQWAFEEADPSLEGLLPLAQDTGYRQESFLPTVETWSANSSAHSPAVVPDRTQAISPEKTPKPRLLPGSWVSGPDVTRDRTPTVGQWSRDKTPIGIPDPRGSGKHVFPNESYVVPRRGSRRQQSAGQIYRAPLTVSRDPYGATFPWYRNEDESRDMERMLLVTRGSLAPTVRADRLYRIQTSETIPQTERLPQLDEENSSVELDPRIKPAWIRGTLTPSQPAKGFALLCSLGTYVMRQIMDDRYGPCLQDEDKPSFKERACFVTFQDGPHVYVAPILGAPKKRTRRPFLTEDKSVRDWWLPVDWVTRHPAQHKQPPPSTPPHPRELEDPKGSQKDAPLKSCFIWSGDPGDRITKLPDEARMAHPQVRYLPNEEIYEGLFVWWNA
ncbi:hypothetical protein LXA43DRAFT_1028561, partial [Ganoderma leucocontextum]